jgi:hypothetical protein
MKWVERQRQGAVHVSSWCAPAGPRLARAAVLLPPGPHGAPPSLHRLHHPRCFATPCTVDPAASERLRCTLSAWHPGRHWMCSRSAWPLEWHVCWPPPAGPPMVHLQPTPPQKVQLGKGVSVHGRATPPLPKQVRLRPTQCQAPLWGLAVSPPRLKSGCQLPILTRAACLNLFSDAPHSLKRLGGMESTTSCACMWPVGQPWVAIWLRSILVTPCGSQVPPPFL